MNFRDLYSTVLLRRQRLLEACLGLPGSILNRTDFGLSQRNLIGETNTSSILDVLNQLFQGEDYWLRVTLEREKSVYPIGGFGTVEELIVAFKTHQGSLLLLTGMGPEGGWGETFTLPDTLEISYSAEIIFVQYLCNEWRSWGMAQQLFLLNGIEPPILELI